MERMRFVLLLERSRVLTNGMLSEEMVMLPLPRPPNSTCNNCWVEEDLMLKELLVVLPFIVMGIVVRGLAFDSIMA